MSRCISYHFPIKHWDLSTVMLVFRGVTRTLHKWCSKSGSLESVFFVEPPLPLCTGRHVLSITKCEVSRSRNCAAFRIFRKKRFVIPGEMKFCSEIAIEIASKPSKMVCFFPNLGAFLRVGHFLSRDRRSIQLNDVVPGVLFLYTDVEQTHGFPRTLVKQNKQKLYS